MSAIVASSNETVQFGTRCRMFMKHYVRMLEMDILSVIVFFITNLSAAIKYTHVNAIWAQLLATANIWSEKKNIVYVYTFELEAAAAVVINKPIKSIR